MQTVMDLWNGRIAPCTHCGCHDAQAKDLLGFVERNRENLRAGLTAAQQEMFQKYMDCSEAYLLRMLELAFYDGFCLGSKLVMESLI